MRIMFLNHQSRREGGPEYEARVQALLDSYASPGTVIEMHYPEDLGGSEVVSHLRKSQALAGLHHALETPALVKKIIEAERNGYDAVVQSNTFDPGVEVARCAVRIPVVGVLRASCHFAATLCDRFALIAPLDSHAVYARRIVENYRMGPFVSGIKAINAYEAGDLSAYRGLIIERMLAVGKELIAEGAQALIPLGGRLVPYVVSPEELEAELKVPVINTKLVGIRHAETLVRGKTSHSVKAYPWAGGLTPENITRRASD
ncbi:MAG TPA: aspartate/glutamate racemase family protein [Candidatus Acidoferrales bacterium]|nr:aspartate/glutamate racemase family protein [Candidatus Acidoferrales bacterium]